MLPNKKTVNELEQKNQILQQIRNFNRHPALFRLMTAFGFDGPSGYHSLEHQLHTQKSFSNANWDFRQGRERLEAKKANLTNEKQQLVLTIAAELNLIAAIKPQKKKYDGIVILGGIGMSPLLRTEYALACKATAPFVFALSSEFEFPKTNLSYKTYAPDAITEFDLMSAAVERIYNRSAEDAQTIMLPIHRWRIKQYNKIIPDTPEIFVISAPSSHPRRRANTADTYTFLANLLPFDVTNLLIVTSSNFRPFQHFDALRTLRLPFGKSVETIGLSTPRTMYHDPQYYLQEINSAINAAYDLYQALL